MRYVGNIHNILFTAFSKNDGLNCGQKLAHIEKLSGTRFVNLTDKELYNTLEKYVSEVVELDEPLSDEEFTVWAETKFEEK